MKRNVAIVLLALCSLAVVAGGILLAGAHPLETLGTLIKSSLGSAQAITGTLRETTPLLIAGVAVFLALRAGLFNIGVEGQFTVGACTCAFIVLRLPGTVGIALGILAGAVAGSLWALPAGLIKAYRGGHEVITTIMLNNVAGALTMALAAGPMKDPTQQQPSTPNIANSSYLGALFDNGTLTVSSALLFGVIAAIGLAIWLKRSVAGYELRATGANTSAATVAGIDVKRVIVRSMATSGAIAGIAGAVQVLAFEHRFYGSFSPGYGFDALGVALLAGQSALLLVPAALLFGILAKGGTMINIIGNVPKGLTTVVVGILIVVAAAIRYRKTPAVES